MTEFTTVATGQVALLIDFENLVRAVDEEDIDCEALFRLAEQYGRVLVANAYADWRMKDVNQYQTDLYGLGIDLIHVLGRRRGAALKNAVDVKMAVDAVSLMAMLPHINVYVIASGDRDFIHVLKELRRHGKIVVGVSPSSAVSEDFTGLCDRFLRYEALTESPAPTGAESIENVRRTLAEVLHANPDGVLGSALKTELRRRLSSSFDESAYGYVSFSSFLRNMDDVVRVVPAPAAGGDLRVYPRDINGAPANSAPPDASQGETKIRTLRRLLKKTRYQPDHVLRRETLFRMFGAMARFPFTLPDVHDRLESDGGSPLTLTDVDAYARLLFYSRVFLAEAGQEEVLFRERRMFLSPDVDSAELLVLAYETAVVMRLVYSADSTIRPADVAGVLDLDHGDTRTLDYCDRLLGNAQDLSERIAAMAASDPDS